MFSTFKNTLAAIALTAGAAAAFAGQAAAQDQTALAAEARGIVAKFAGKLKNEMVTALQSEGPVKAIGVCNISSPAISKEVSADGWTVGRTSLKLRNAASAPDAWEQAALESMDAEKAKGADPSKIERIDIVEKDGKKTFRYMKAIPTAGEPCLACHGSDIKEPVKAKLKELYPHDQATGYKEGDIRGAFTLSKPLP